MGTLEVFSFFLVMFLSNIYVLAYDCSKNSCSPYGLDSRFPFRIKDQQHDSCGYPGFNLTCKIFDRLYGPKTILDLPLSGEFVVTKIDYVNQEIQLEDPDNCLPKRLLDLNLSNSLFKGVNYQKYTFLNCTHQSIFDFKREDSIYCLSRGNYYVLAVIDISLYDYCEVIKTVLVPVQFLDSNPFSFLGDYFQSITLTWDEPDCRYCEVLDQGCRLRNVTSHETECFQKKSNTSVGDILPIPLGILCFIFCVVCYFMKCSNKENQPSNEEINNATTLQPVIPLISLNESTIDSYPKIVLGESRRLPNPGDNICPICLSEYLPKEILKIIPECNHNFHADCIDQWLHMNMTCPVCRNSPT